MKLITRRLNALIRRIEEQVQKAQRSTRAERFRLALKAYEATGQLPDDPDARKWCLQIGHAVEEFDSLHTVIDDPAGYANPAFAAPSALVLPGRLPVKRD